MISIINNSMSETKTAKQLDLGKGQESCRGWELGCGGPSPSRRLQTKAALIHSTSCPCGCLGHIFPWNFCLEIVLLIYSVCLAPNCILGLGSNASSSEAFPSKATSGFPIVIHSLHWSWNDCKLSSLHLEKLKKKIIFWTSHTCGRCVLILSTPQWPSNVPQGP